MNWVLDSFTYSQKQKEYYQKHGFCIFPAFLSSIALETLQTGIDNLLLSLHPKINSADILGLHQYEHWLWELITQVKLLDLIQTQVGENIVIWSSHLLCKAPVKETAVPWHQDAPFWNVAGRLAGAIWIPCDDIDENGAMFVLPGWHTRGVLPLMDSKDRFFSREISTDALPRNVAEIKFRYQLRAGQLAIHDPLLPHGSEPNSSNHRRRVLILRYMAADGKMGKSSYKNCYSNEPFAREYFLVRGKDIKNRGLRKNPWDASGVGYYGED